VLLAVLVLEFGPGACLTLALALSAQPAVRQTRLDASDGVQPATPRIPDVSRTPTPPVQVVQGTDVLAPVRAAGCQQE
jgi:hypothetical protein